jgi:hypothetical protein
MSGMRSSSLMIMMACALGTGAGCGHNKTGGEQKQTGPMGEILPSS